MSTHSQDYTIRNLLLLLKKRLWCDVFSAPPLSHAKKNYARLHFACHTRNYFLHICPLLSLLNKLHVLLLVAVFVTSPILLFLFKKNNSFHKRDAETARLTRPAARLINDTFVLSYPLMCNAFSDRERVGTHVGVSFLHYFKLLCHIFCIHAIFISEKVLCIYEICAFYTSLRSRCLPWRLLYLHTTRKPFCDPHILCLIFRLAATIWESFAAFTVCLSLRLSEPTSVCCLCCNWSRRLSAPNEFSRRLGSTSSNCLPSAMPLLPLL